MSVVHLHRMQVLNTSLEEAWHFFSSPENLSVITPRYMNFRILSENTDKIFAGQRIMYKVNILPFVRVRWETEITEVKHLESFTDEQRSGPYGLWRHRHEFRQTTGGLEMTDTLSYEAPLGLLGTIANRLFVERQVNGIFDYRNKVLKGIFK